MCRYTNLLYLTHLVYLSATPYKINSPTLQYGHKKRNLMHVYIYEIIAQYHSSKNPKKMLFSNGIIHNAFIQRQPRACMHDALSVTEQNQR